MYRSYRVALGGFGLVISCASAPAQVSTVPRLWMEETLNAVRGDAPRPTVQARNMFHMAAALYDVWAVYDTTSRPWLIGNSVQGFNSPFAGLPQVEDITAARVEAMSHAAFRILDHRFLGSPGAAETFDRILFVMDSLGFEIGNDDTNYASGSPAALGNHIAQQYIDFGSLDRSNEQGNYGSQVYFSLNPRLIVEEHGNPTMFDPNRWQPITLPEVLDDEGQLVAITPDFVGAEWGNVIPFSLRSDQVVSYFRNGAFWNVYLDAGEPAYLDINDPSGLESDYKWNHVMMSIWQSHLDPVQEVYQDISPGAVGNITSYPETPEEYRDFYDLFNGGDGSTGHPVNPATGQPYAPNIAKRADHARVLAEFWANGMDGETVAGQWFEILFDAMALPEFQRRWKGEGPELEPLEYDVKAFFALGAAMHDAAIVAWSHKGYYDHVRPVSAIRYMADRGQCSDPMLPRYHPAGLPLIPGYIELVTFGDPLAGDGDEHVDKVKLFTHRGPGALQDPTTEIAGVGWILAENWWPYQLPTVVTSPYAGYISGHSTLSHTAAEVLASITGSPYFPGGLIEYVIPQNNFLECELGPSEELRLQWASYRDAADACGLAGIWGGVYPPTDDMPGRRAGMELGPQVMEHLDSYILEGLVRVDSIVVSRTVLSPADVGAPFTMDVFFSAPMQPSAALEVVALNEDPFMQVLAPVDQEWMDEQHLALRYSVAFADEELFDIQLSLTGLSSTDGRPLRPHLAVRPFSIDMRPPTVDTLQPSTDMVTANLAGPSSFELMFTFSETCDTTMAPVIVLSAPIALAGALEPNTATSSWENERTYRARYDVTPTTVGPVDVDVRIGFVQDVAGNVMELQAFSAVFAVDVLVPSITQHDASDALLNIGDVGSVAWVLITGFSEAMDTTAVPTLSFANGDPFEFSLELNDVLSGWDSELAYRFVFALANGNEEWPELDAVVSGYSDASGNVGGPYFIPSVLTIDTRRPEVSSATVSTPVLADADVGAEALRAVLVFSEAMDTGSLPLVQGIPGPEVQGSLAYTPGSSSWLDATHFEAVFSLTDAGVEVDGVGFSIAFARDVAGNAMIAGEVEDLLRLDTRNPVLLSLVATPDALGDMDLGAGGLMLMAVFDEAMNAAQEPLFTFDPAGLLAPVLAFEQAVSAWVDGNTYGASFGVYAAPVSIPEVSAVLSLAQDEAGNLMASTTMDAVFSIMLSGVGVAEYGGPAVLRAFPNPVLAGAPLYVNGTAAAGQAALTVIDARGRSVYAGIMVLPTGGIASIALPVLAPGLYQLFLDTGSERYAVRFVVEGG